MAKLKAPLLSLGATGAIGKSIVFFNWKGLDVAREYVIPSNPRSTAQVTQRSYVTAAVALVHAAQAAASHAFTDIDKSAYSLLGSLQATPRTWFNTVVKQCIEQYAAGKSSGVFREGVIVETDGQVELTIYSDGIDAGGIQSAWCYYGTSKTNMFSRIEGVSTLGEHKIVSTIPSLTNGTKYYFQMRTNDIAGCIGIDSGIYIGTPAA